MSPPVDVPRVDVVVAVGDSHLGQLAEVADRLRSAGMDIKDILDAVGAISGSVDESRLDQLAGVEGVESVERSRQYRIAPPGSPIQ